MSRTIICPHCGVSNSVKEEQSGAVDRLACEHCGRCLREQSDSVRPTTVLCIDDDPLVLHFFRDFLPAHGYRPLTVTDGLPGIELARQTRPDVILLDIMLRGLSGYDICRKVRADPALHDIPIILLTVLDDPGVATTGRAAGADLILRKPADPETIVRAIEWMLRTQRDAPRE